MHALTDFLTADFTEAQSVISEKLSTALQEVERGQRSLHDEWVVLLKQQEALGGREQRLQRVIVTRTSMQLSNKLNRLLSNAKQNCWRRWIICTGQSLFKRFKLHAATKLRRRFIVAAAFVKWRSSREPDATDHDIWNSYMRLESFNKFQEIQREAADKEAMFLEQLREVRALHIASSQRERQQQLDLARVMSEYEQEKKRSDKLDQTMALQCAYIAKHEQDSIELQQQFEALLAVKDEGEQEHIFQLLLHSEAVEEKDQIIEQLRQKIQNHHFLLQQKQEQQELLHQQLKEEKERVEAVKLEHAAAEERRLQYRRTEVLGRVVQRMRNFTVAAAFGAWVDCVREAREELLVASLEQMQNGISVEQQLRDGQQKEQAILRQQLKEEKERVEAVKLEHAAAEERRLLAIDEVKRRVVSSQIELKECEVRYTFQYSHQSQAWNEKSYKFIEPFIRRVSCISLSASGKVCSQFPSTPGCDTRATQNQHSTKRDWKQEYEMSC